MANLLLVATTIGAVLCSVGVSSADAAVASDVVTQGCFDEVVPSANNIYNRQGPLIDGKRIVSQGEMKDWRDCQTACLSKSPPCHSWVYFFGNYTPPVRDDHQLTDSIATFCFARTDDIWDPQFVFGNTMVSGINCKSPPATALPNAPPPNVHFSWDHVPVFFHTSNYTGPYNQEALEIMAKFPLVTIEKYQGPHSGVHYPKEQWVCCEEDRIVETLQAVKKINPNVTGIMYYNMILDFPQYRLHQNFAKNESWWLHDDSGNVVRVGGDGHEKADLLVYDTTQEAVANLFIHACLDLVPTGAVDGCFVDRPVDGAPGHNISVARQLDVLGSHIVTMQKFQQLLKRGPLVANHAYGMPGINAAMIEGFSADKESIAELMFTADRGKLVEAHVRGIAPCPTDESIQDHLAAFLIGAGEFSYFGCGPWYSAATSISDQWKESYDKPLGKPLGAASKEGNVYTRTFASGTVVHFDVSTNKGTIHWAGSK